MAFLATLGPMPFQRPFSPSSLRVAKDESDTGSHHQQTGTLPCTGHHKHPAEDIFRSYSTCKLQLCLRCESQAMTPWSVTLGGGSLHRALLLLLSLQHGWWRLQAFVHLLMMPYALMAFGYFLALPSASLPSACILTCKQGSDFLTQCYTMG